MTRLRPAAAPLPAICLSVTALALSVVVACSGPLGSSPSATTAPNPSPVAVVSRASGPPSASSVPSAEPTESDPVANGSPSQPGTEEPPIATLTNAAGASVDGAIGTFTWAGLTSDSPWLAGSRVGARVGEDLHVRFVGGEPLRWSALAAPAGKSGAQARSVGDGQASVHLIAPTTPAVWEIAVRVTFAEGEVLYHWQVAVTR